MSCERVIHKAPLSLEAFSTLIAQDADSVGDHVAFQQPCRSLLLSTNLTGERSFSPVKGSFVGAKSLHATECFVTWLTGQDRNLIQMSVFVYLKCCCGFELQTTVRARML